MRGRRAGRLWHAAARAVTGRGVEVRWAVPELAHPGGVVADGEALIFQGKPLIRLRPGLSDARKWYIFCHELAHICCGHLNDLPDVAIDFGPASIQRDVGDGNPWREVQAEHFRRLEIDWRVSRRVGQDASLTQKLRALCAEWQRGAGRR